MNLCLIGYRGSGKTTVGRKLADRLWRAFVDLDEVIVGRAGRTISDIFQQGGEVLFRDLESQALAEVLKQDDRIIALGGGAVLRQENRAAIKSAGCRVIYLRCEPSVLLQRIQADAGTAAMRPNLTALGGGIEEIQSLLQQREPIYREVADAELDVTGLSPDEALERLARLL